MNYRPQDTLDAGSLYVFKERLNRLMEEEFIELKMHGNAGCIKKELSKHVLSVLPHVPAFDHCERQAILPEEPLV